MQLQIEPTKMKMYLTVIFVCVFFLSACATDKSYDRKQSIKTVDVSKLARKTKRKEDSLFLLNVGKPQSVDYGVATSIYKDVKSCYYITSYHLFKTPYKVIGISPWIYKEMAEKNMMPVHMVASDPVLDISILRSDLENGFPCHPVKMAHNTGYPGTNIYGYGNPINGVGVVSKGIISGVWQIEPHGDVVISDMMTVSGYSGGAVFNVKKQFVGMLIGKSDNTNSRSYAYIISSSRLIPYLENTFSSLDTMVKF